MRTKGSVKTASVALFRVETLTALMGSDIIGILSSFIHYIVLINGQVYYVNGSF